MNDETLAALLEIVHLPGLGPARARWLLSEGEPQQVVMALRQRRVPVVAAEAPTGVTRALLEKWFAAIGRGTGRDLLDAHRSAGIMLLGPDDPLWPFTDDPEPPVLLFGLGCPDALAVPHRVAVVGTRRCTSVGRNVAARLGEDLAAAGVCVVSGLALGIDGAAHRGALEAAHPSCRPVAVVGAGLDRIYPPGNRALWAALADDGLILSEAPLGAPPERWRFPARNRLLAGLSSAVVVVESHERGGALLTADEAAERGVVVLAVPGSVRSAASVGSNGLLFDGCPPVRDVDDILAALGLDTSPVPARSGQVSSDWSSEMPRDGEIGRAVLSEAATGPVHVDTLVALSGQSVTSVLGCVRALEDAGRIRLEGGWVHLGGSTR